MQLNRWIGKLFAVLFGLVLLIEVGCLPLFTSLAVKFEKSIVAESAEKENSENAESITKTLIAVVSISDKTFPRLLNSISEQQAFRYEKDNAQVHEHVFLEQRSIRI